MDIRHALVINDPAQAARLAGSRRLCLDLGLDCRRIRPPALDHPAVSRCMQVARSRCSTEQEQRRQCQALTPKECSILLAHAAAWRAIARTASAGATRGQSALVIEDDAILSTASPSHGLSTRLRSEPSAPVAQLGLCLPSWCFDQQHCRCERYSARGGGTEVACTGLCAHAYRLNPAGAELMLKRHKTWPHAKVDLIFPRAPMIGGTAPCEVGGAIDGDVGTICQNRSIRPMFDPALVR